MNISCDCQSSRPSPKKLCCPKGVEIDYVELPASLGTSAPGQPNAPENGAYKNAVVKYVADGHVYIYTSEGIPVLLSDGSGGGSGDVISVNGKTGEVVLTTSDLENDSDYQTGDEVVSAIEDAISQLEIPTNVSELTNDAGYQTASEVASAVAGEATLRQSADNNLQGQIDAISASSDVTDIVGTYAELQAYDTSTLGDKDIIKVLQDESRNDETTYYRWSTTTQTFTLIGEEGPYYTKSQADGRFVAQTTYTTDKAALEASIGTKQDELTAGNNIQISGSVISATDTTYSDFTGTDGQTAGTAGLVPAPATTDADKFLKSDGTWDTAGSAINVVQTTGTSTTDVMSQVAVSNLIWPTGYESIKTRISIGGASVSRLDDGGVVVAPGGTYAAAGQHSVAIGRRALAYGSYSAAIGDSAQTPTYSQNNIALGPSASIASGSYAVAVGSSAYATKSHSVALGSYAQPTRAGEVNIGTGTNNYGYNSTSYRVLGGVHDPVDLHDAATKNYVDNVAISFAAISGATAPTTATEGEYVGQLYYDTANDTMYYLSSIDDTQTPVEYNWSTFGGGGPTVVQTTGTSTTDVMSQDAVTNELYDSVGNIRLGESSTSTASVGPNIIIGKGDTVLAGNHGKIIIGDNITDTNAQTCTIEIGSRAKSASGDNIAIGTNSNSGSGSEAVALGANSSCNGESRATAIGARAVAARGGVALGAYSRATRAGEVNIGSTDTSWGYNSTNYRVLGGVHPAVDDHDAVTLGQMNDAIGNIETILQTLNSGTGAQGASA